MKLLKTLLTVASLGLASGAMASGGNPVEAALEADPWLVKAVNLQNQVDRNAPFYTNNTLGSHNTYNSHEYADDGYIRYLDPQQKHTIGEQLELGARFIELDVHWAVNSSNYRYHLMLCHAQCSLTDRYLNQGLDEVKSWLDSDASKDQVLILYFEDKSGDDQHDEMYDQINNKIGSYVYRSNGCKAIPDSLSKADVLASGKKVVIWKDGRDGSKNCSDNNNLKNMVFTSLGGLSRVYEDHTFFGGTLVRTFTSGGNANISASNITDYFKQGQNLVNLDSFTYDDGRTEASIWSWDRNEPNNYNGNQDCAVQWGNGRWDDAPCGNSYAYACQQIGTNNWVVTGNGSWSGGLSACAGLGGSYKYAVPTNSRDNEAVKVAKGSRSHVWLNYNDQGQEGKWVAPAFEYRELRDNRSNLCMDLDGGVIANGRQVRLWSCNGSAAQKWMYEQSTGLIRSVSNPNYCLDIAGGNLNNGGNVQLWSCIAGHQNHTWDLLGNTIRPRANHSLAIDAFGSSSGANLGLWTVHGGDNQSWTWGHQ